MSIDPNSGATVPDNATQPFPDPGETALDHAAQAATRIIRQYRNSPKLQGLIAGLAALAQRIEDCAVSIGPLDDPAVATGNQANPAGEPGPLDVTGDLVGQSRVLSSGTVVADALFRVLIAMRILRNASIASGPEFVDALTKIFSPPFVGADVPFRFYDLGGMVVGLELGSGSAPSQDTIALLADDGPTPKAMGVTIGREWYDPTNWFAFEEDTRTGASGFAELGGDPSFGGEFAELF